MSARDAALSHLQNRIGTRFGPSRWITVDQDLIDRFGALTQDDQFIHVDPEQAADTAMGGTIAQGFLSLSLASRFAYDCFKDLAGQSMGINYGFDRIRFLAPVPAGARLRGCFVLCDVAPRGPADIMRLTELTVEIEGVPKPALLADWRTLIRFDSI